MNRLIDILVDQYAYDVSVFSEPWMYYPLLIPVIFYLVFFLAKWCVLTAPMWFTLHSLIRVSIEAYKKTVAEKKV